MNFNNHIRSGNMIVYRNDDWVAYQNYPKEKEYLFDYCSLFSTQSNHLWPIYYKENDLIYVQRLRPIKFDKARRSLLNTNIDLIKKRGKFFVYKELKDFEPSLIQGYNFFQWVKSQTKIRFYLDPSSSNFMQLNDKIYWFDPIY